MEIYSARYVLPVVAPVLRDGAVAVHQGRIVAVGPRDDVRRSASESASHHDLGDAAIFPGLVNAHAHLELSWLASGALPGGDYVGWITALLERRAAGPPPDARECAEGALRTLVARGTVAIGDVTNDGWTASMIARSPLHAVVFLELYDLVAERAEATLLDATRRLEEIARDADVAAAGTRIRVALSAHAPHTTSVPLLRALAGRSIATGDPLAIHVAESREEVDLLRHGTGRLRALLSDRGACDDSWVPPGRTPVDHLRRLGVLGPRTVAVHCVHLDGPDHRSLQASGTIVVACPRSNARLGVGRAPVLALLREGVKVALGTDSLASAPDLDLLAEMAALRETYPDLGPATVLRMATLHGAAALGLADRLGSIEVGKLADLMVLPLAAGDDHPLDALCSLPATVVPLADAARHLSSTS